MALAEAHPWEKELFHPYTLMYQRNEVDQKGTVSVISSDFSFIEQHVRFKTVLAFVQSTMS